MWPEVHMLPTPISCNSTYRLRYWNIPPQYVWRNSGVLQQYLPFTVLKLIFYWRFDNTRSNFVATVLTVYGIETGSYHEIHHQSSWSCNSTYRLRYWNYCFVLNCYFHDFLVATVLTVYGIETALMPTAPMPTSFVATVLTVYGIETV